MNKLTPRQLKFIDELFRTGGDEAAAGQSCNVQPGLYQKWFSTKIFTDEITRRCDCAKRASRILLTQYFTVAAAKLVALTGSEKEETARRACLDILSLNNEASEIDDETPTEESVPNISPAIASKLLAVLAEAD